MRKVLLNLCTSIDGYIEGENGEIDWCFTDQDYGMTDFLQRIDTIFIGRKSYEQLKEMAPEAFSDKKMVVFSRDESFQCKDRVINSSLESSIKLELQKNGRDIWLFGGAELTNHLLDLDLVDEMILSVHPLLLGAGKPLFTSSSKRKSFELKDAVKFSSGLVQQHYERKN